MEWLIIVIIVLCMIGSGTGNNYMTEYHPPPDYEDDPPLPMEEL